MRVAKRGVYKKKVFIFLFNKKRLKKKKNQADIDVKKTTISVRSQNPYKFPLINHQFHLFR